MDPLVEATSGDMANLRKKDGRSAFCNLVPKCLPVDERFRSVDITLDDGCNPNDLPRSFHDAILLEMFGLEEPQGSEGGRHQDVQFSRMASSEEQRDGSIVPS